jgi:serine/threonine protein kinase
VRYIECYTLDDHIIIVMEYMEYGDLTGYLNKHGALSEPMVQEVARQILRGLEYVHQKMVTHRDIKPDNILIQSLDPIVVKLSDFGLSKRVDDSTFLKTFCGTLLYCAPEVYHERTSENIPRRSLGDRYGQSADMWSFGAVLFVLLCNRPPFAGKEQPRLMLDFITTQPVDVRPLRECGVSARGITFVKRLLNVRSDLRPTETECLRDPWLNDGTDPPNDSEMADAERIHREEGGEEEVEDVLGASSQVSQLRLSPQIEGRVVADSIGEESREFDDVKRRDFAVAAHPQPEAPSSAWSSDELQAYNNMMPRRITGRLFGEISGSMARSSAVFGLPNRDPRGIEVSDQFDLELLHTENQNVKSRQSESQLHEAQVVQSSPSLQGAESLVNQLQMAGSPSSGNSPLLTPNSPRTPTTPKSRMATPTSIGPRLREEDPAEAREPAPKRQKFDRQIRLIPPTPINRGVGLNTSETRTTAQNKSGSEAANLGKTSTNRKGDEANSGPSQGPVAGTEGQGLVARTDAHQEPIDSLSRGQVEETSVNSEHQDPAGEPNHGSIPLTVGPIGTNPSGDGFVRPLPVWGKLVPKPGSDPNISLSLTRDIISYGRSELSNFVVSPEKTLISRRHLVIQLFKPGLTSEDIKAAGKTWMDYPEMTPIIKVLSSRGMWINDRRIKQNQYARIYNGDELTVYAEPFRPKTPGMFLTFVCEFYHGDWTQRRPGYPLFQNGEMDNFAEDGRVQFPGLWETESNNNLAATMIPHEQSNGSLAGTP